MMMGLLVFKAKCKDIFEKHYKVLRAMMKILVSAGIFSVILYQLPFQEGLNYYAVPVVILLALFCGFIPDLAVMCVAALLVLIGFLYLLFRPYKESEVFSMKLSVSSGSRARA